jgi:hypothetical protein
MKFVADPNQTKRDPDPLFDARREMTEEKCPAPSPPKKKPAQL